jgi:hypothetical protein
MVFIFRHPLIIHLENHCSVEAQKQMSSMIKNLFGSALYIPNDEEPLLPAQVSPEQLRGKIIIKVIISRTLLLMDTLYTHMK